MVIFPDSLVDYLATEPGAKRRAVLEHITLALQPILEKGIIDHTIIHRAIVEYLSVSTKVRKCFDNFNLFLKPAL